MIVTEDVAEIVLVAAVDPVSRRDMAAALGGAGFCVLTASDAVGALDLLRDFGATIDYLITDIDLHDICSGLQVAHQFRFLKPYGAVVFLGSLGACDFQLFPDKIVIGRPVAISSVVEQLSRLRQERSERIYA